jgi:hypothetical protein
MDRRTIRDVAATVAAGAGVLLLADLSLGWHEVKVATAGIVDISATSSGWSGLGLVAGLLTIGMLVYMIRPLRHKGSIDIVQAAVAAVLGLAVFGFATAAALTGSASIKAPEAAVEIGATMWPAYVAIALGAVVAGGVVTAFALVMRGVTAPSRVIHTSG